MDIAAVSAAIRQLRHTKGLTQAQLAALIGVSPKAVSKWENARGLPDIALLQPLAAVLGVSVTELMGGGQVLNRNRAANMLRSVFYVCPVCGNVLFSGGSALVSCCGLTLSPLEAKEAEGEHCPLITPVEDEHFLSIPHPMTREHHISFAALVRTDRVQLVKLYPEGNAETRFPLHGMGILYWYCTRHGLFCRRL